MVTSAGLQHVEQPGERVGIKASTQAHDDATDGQGLDQEAMR